MSEEQVKVVMVKADDPRLKVRSSDHAVRLALIAAGAAVIVPLGTAAMTFLNQNHIAAVNFAQQQALALKTEAISQKVVEVGHTTDSTLVRVDGRLTQALDQLADILEQHAKENPKDQKAQQRALDARKAAHPPIDARTSKQVKAADDGTNPVMPIEHPSTSSDGARK